MKLQDSLEKQGEILFRNRGFIPILFILFSVPVSYFNSFDCLIDNKAVEYTILFSSIGLSWVVVMLPPLVYLYNTIKRGQL